MSGSALQTHRGALSSAVPAPNLRPVLRQGLALPGDSGDARLQTLERLKTNYDERAYRQLKSLLDPK